MVDSVYLSDLWCIKKDVQLFEKSVDMRKIYNIKATSVFC